MPDPGSPEVTVVVVAGERFGLTERCLDALHRFASVPFNLVCVDGGSPGYVHDQLRSREAAGGLDLIRSDTFLTPNAARNLGFARATTPYVAFLDNDVEVAPGWLSALLRCAKETGAGLVSPVHLDGRVRDGLIRSARRSLRLHGGPGGWLEVGDPDAGRALVESRPTLERRAIGFPCSSCMLVERAVFDRIGPLDESLLPSLDGIDLALRLQGLAAPIVLEPTALVAHPSPTGMAAGDVPWFRVRWSDDWLARSRDHFVAKWQVSSDSAHLDEEMTAAVRHRRSLAIPNPDGLTPDLGDPLPPETIAQTFTQLAALCRDRRWSSSERRSLEDAYVVAVEMFGDGLRDFGRPFLCHVVGVASILVAYGARVDLAMAALLHSAYAHGFFPREWRATASLQRRYLADTAGAKAEALVAAFYRLGYDAEVLQGDPERVPLDTALAVLIWMANGIDGWQEGSRPSDDEPFRPTPEARAHARTLADLLGVHGLAATFDALDAKGFPDAFPQRVVWVGGHGRLSPVGERIISMANDAVPFPVRGHLLAAGGGKVSVVIANYNYGRYLDQAIESALDQTYGHREVIVVDDGSTDDSRAVIARYARRVVGVLKPNGGQGSAWNAGFARSSGDIVVFLDSDDVLYPEACETIVDAWEAHLGRVQFPLETTDDWLVSLRDPAQGETLEAGDVWIRQLHSAATINALAAGNAYPRSVLERLLPMPEPGFRVGADGYLRFLSSRFGPVVTLPDALVGHRVHGANSFWSEDPGLRAARGASRNINIHGAAIDYLAAHPDDRTGEEILILRANQLYWILRSASGHDARVIRRALAGSIWRTMGTRAKLGPKRREIAYYLGLLAGGWRSLVGRPDARPRFAEAIAARPPGADRRMVLGERLGPLTLSGFVPHEGGAVTHGDDGVSVVCDPRQWAYSALLPLELPEGWTGHAILRLEVTVTAGQLGIGVLDKAGLDRLLGETSAPDRARTQELTLEIADLARAGTLVLRSWAPMPIRTEAVLRRADLWRPGHSPGHKGRRLQPREAHIT